MHETHALQTSLGKLPLYEQFPPLSSGHDPLQIKDCGFIHHFIEERPSVTAEAVIDQLLELASPSSCQGWGSREQQGSMRQKRGSNSKQLTLNNKPTGRAAHPWRKEQARDCSSLLSVEVGCCKLEKMWSLLLPRAQY
jgi:hypothetical protein